MNLTQVLFCTPIKKGIKIPKENHPISSGCKKGSMNSQNKVYLHVINMRNN